MANIDLLVVGGGGGGGGGTGGGGGAGGVDIGTRPIAVGAYTVVVGPGGAPGTSTSVSGANGVNSQFDTLFGTGGGGGGANGLTGNSGGSGGGGGAVSGPAGAGNPGEGNNGGTGAATANYGAGGGGGAGAVGANGTPSNGAAGGAGRSSSISGATVFYGGGGGGGMITAGLGGAGGTGGGGAGGNAGGGFGIAGTPNTGGGGGGSCDNAGNGGAGGSGIVIARYLTGTMTAFGGQVTTNGAYTIHTFTVPGSYTFTVWASPPDAVGNIAAPDIASACSILAAAADCAPTAGGTLTINGVSLSNLDYRIVTGNQTIAAFTETDWFTPFEDSRSAWVIIKGDLTINAGQVFKPAHRKLFTVVYVTGNLVVNGELSMSLRGANHSPSGSNIAAGDILLLAATVSGVTNPTVPAVGAAGAAGAFSASNNNAVGTTGAAGVAGQTGGGGGGAVQIGAGGGTNLTGGTGRAGTSFSGGSAGGPVSANANGVVGGAAEVSGGAGGAAISPQGYGASGSSGNPGGVGVGTGTQGNSGTGGTLIVFTERGVTGTGGFTADGQAGAAAGVTGGSGSGGGSVTVFVRTSFTNAAARANGGAASNNTVPGGAGGNGTARALLFPAFFPAVSTIRVSTAATLGFSGFTAAVSFGIATTAALALPTPLAASAKLGFATNAIFAAPALAGRPTVTVAAAANLVAPVRFAAAATITFSTVPTFAVVRFTAAPTFTIGATATLTTRTEKAHASTATILLAGIEARARIAGLTIRDVLNDAPNSCSLTIDGVETPECEQTLRVLLDLDAPKLLFNGAIQKVDLSYEGRAEQLAYPCDAIDDTARANRMRPFGTWTNISATTVAQQLMAQFAPGFTAAHVQPNLPPVTIILDGTEGMSGALKQVTTQIGGYFYFEDADLHLFLEETTAAPDPIDGTPGRLLDDPPITITRDDSQLRTRQYGRGHGESLIADVLAGENILPVENAGAWFGAVGGKAIIAGQRLAYTGLQTSPGGSLVGPGAGPSVAPNVLAVAGAGLTNGAYKYAFSFVTASGESLTGPQAAITAGPVLGSPVANPTSAPNISTPTVGAGVDGGTHQYAVTWATASGETLPGPPAAVTVGTQLFPVNPPPAGMVFTPAYGGDLPWDTSYFYHWSCVFVTAAGETTISPPINEKPTFSPRTFVLSSIPIGPPGTIARRIYLTSDGSPNISRTTINDNVTTVHSVVSAADYNSKWQYSGIVLPPNNTAGSYGVDYHVVPLYSLPSGPAGVTTKKLYRTVAGGSQLRLVAALDNNVSSYSDTTPDSSLGANAPTTNTTAATTNLNAAAVSNLATGPGGTTTRKLYRTVANGAQLKLLATINDNSTTNYGQDVTPDASLGANAPTSDLSGLGGSVIAGTVIAGAPTLPTSGTAPFNKTSALLPPDAPLLTPVSGIGVDVGQHSWACTFVTAAGETVPGAVATRVLGPLASPAQPTIGTPTGNGGVAPGTYDYCCAFTTVNGETIPGPISAPVTVTPVGVPTPAMPTLVSNGPNSNKTSRAYGHTIGYCTTFVTAQGETLPSNILYTTTLRCTQQTYESSAITLTLYNSTNPRVTGINLYSNIDGGPFYLTYGGISNSTGNASQTLVDIGPDVTSGPTTPTVDATLQTPGNIPITLPLGASPVTGRKLYRRTGGGLFYLVTTLADLTTTAYTDTALSANLGPPALSVSTAGTFYQVVLSGISIGASNVIARRIYRTTLAGQLKFAGQLLDNTTTTFTDATPDSGLGPNAPTSDTSGGGGILGGWALLGNQAIRYTGVSGNNLVGIPPSGPGALQTSVVYGTQILPAPALIGVTGLTLPMPKGTPVCIWVRRDDLVAQAQQAAVDVANGIVPADGVYEGPVLVDERRNEASMIALCDANLALYAQPIVTVTYACRDVKTKSGKTVIIDLDSPAIHETLTIQEVSITEIDIAPGLLPRFSVTASSVRFSLDDILRRLLTSSDAQTG